MDRFCTENPLNDEGPIDRPLNRPAPSPAVAELLRLIHTWCDVPAANAVHIIDQGVWIPWHVVHTIRAARDLGTWGLVSELRQFGRVLAADCGLTIVVSRY